MIIGVGPEQNQCPYELTSKLAWKKGLTLIFTPPFLASKGIQLRSEWYGVKTDDPSEINEKCSNKKIADVLYLFKDKHS